MENNAGTQIAVGDSRGRVFLVDVATRSTRQLPTPVGTGVTWLAYSEDDAWLAATAIQDGSWWPAWTGWLAERSGAPAPLPPLGRADSPFVLLGDAPGRYVSMA